MPDERQDSVRQGIHPPEESPTGKAAEAERRRRAAEGPAIGGGMGGTSDADRPADEAQLDAARAAPAPLEDREDLEQHLADRSRVLEETREAGRRAQGGGIPDEEDIDRSASEGLAID